MTVRFGKGDRHLPSFPPGQRSSDPSWGDESTFRAREHFVDVFEEEAREALEDFLQRVEPSVAEVFETVLPDPPGLDEEAMGRLDGLLKRHDHQLAGPPEVFHPSPYADAFGGWPPPTPHGFVKGELDRVLKELPVWAKAWSLLGWRLSAILEDQLDSWSEEWNLLENKWVASHLLARICKGRLLGEEKAKLDHVVFGSPGVLARFKDSLDGSFGHFRDWDPTQEQWSEWRKAAGSLFKKAVIDHKVRVLERSDGPDVHLDHTPTKLEPERDFQQLVRFQVFGDTLD